MLAVRKPYKQQYIQHTAIQQSVKKEEIFSSQLPARATVNQFIHHILNIKLLRMIH
jgi:hypothetical protein